MHYIRIEGEGYHLRRTEEHTLGHRRQGGTLEGRNRIEGAEYRHRITYNEQRTY